MQTHPLPAGKSIQNSSSKPDQTGDLLMWKYSMLNGIFLSFSLSFRLFLLVEEPPRSDTWGLGACICIWRFMPPLAFGSPEGSLQNISPNLIEIFELWIIFAYVDFCPHFVTHFFLTLFSLFQSQAGTSAVCMTSGREIFGLSPTLSQQQWQ